MSGFTKKIANPEHYCPHPVPHARTVLLKKKPNKFLFSSSCEQGMVTGRFGNDENHFTFEGQTDQQSERGWEHGQKSMYWESDQRNNKSVDICCHISQSREGELEDRFGEIEKLFGRQNCNLRQHNAYLLVAIERMKEKEKKYKKQIKGLKNQVTTLQTHNQTLNLKYQEAIRITKTQKESSSLQQSKPKQYIPACQKAHGDTATSLNISDTLEDLSQKFDTLMCEYQKTREPSIRKQCMKIASQLKKLKNANGLCKTTKQ